MSVLMIGSKPFDNAPTVDNADWTSRATGTSGSVATGTDTGSVRTTMFTQIGNLNGGASDIATVTSGTVCMGRAWTFAKTAPRWDTPLGTTLTDTDESGTTVSATASQIDIQAGDFLVMGVSLKGDSFSHSSQSLAVTGCTLGTQTWSSAFSTTNGGGMRFYVGICAVTAGAATGGSTYTATSSLSGASATAVGLVRLRELFDPLDYGKIVAKNASILRASYF